MPRPIGRMIIGRTILARRYSGRQTPLPKRRVTHSGTASAITTPEICAANMLTTTIKVTAQNINHVTNVKCNPEHSQLIPGRPTACIPEWGKPIATNCFRCLKIESEETSHHDWEAKGEEKIESGHYGHWRSSNDKRNNCTLGLSPVLS